MKLNPTNETPGYSDKPVRKRVYFQRVRETDTACIVDGINIGHIHREVDGNHLFHPIYDRNQYWPAWVLADVASHMAELAELDSIR